MIIIEDGMEGDTGIKIHEVECCCMKGNKEWKKHNIGKEQRKEEGGEKKKGKLTVKCSNKVLNK